MRRVLLVIFLLSIATPAAAQPENGAKTPDERYHEAQEHFLARRYTEALPIFQELTYAKKGPNARLYVARCLRELKDYAEAYKEMDLTVREAEKLAKHEDRYTATKEAAEKERKELRERVALLSVYVGRQVPGLVVEVNGTPMDPSRFGKRMPIRPGRAMVRARARGFDAFEEELTLEPGEIRTFVENGKTRTEKIEPYEVVVALTPQPWYTTEVAAKAEAQARAKAKAQEKKRRRPTAPVPPRLPPKSGSACSLTRAPSSARLFGVGALVVLFAALCARRSMRSRDGTLSDA
jgi:hypothetical protein